MADAGKRYRAGDPIQDLCRACKADRDHTVIVADAEGRPLRVMCDFCRSQHDYRGAKPAREARPAAERPAAGHDPFPLVAERERTEAPLSTITSDGSADLELMLRRVLREELGLTAVVPAERWRGGELVLRPGKPGLQEKKWPIESFFHKVVMIRNRLRVLEQQVNASEMPEADKLKLQGYVTACYGSLTSFNLLFAEEKDQFRGAGGGDGPE